MREIKFRVWDKILGKMYYPGERRFSIDLFGGVYDDDCDEPLDDKSYRLILMQYTGLKDKNGKEVYEGDIIEHEHYNDIFIVKIDGYSGTYILICNLERIIQKLDVSQMLHDSKHLLKIIGNIYENPELIN